MNLFPKASGARPRVACEIAAQGVVAARSVEAIAPLAAVARVELAAGAVTPSLKPGNIADRVAVVEAIRRTLESIGERAHSRDGNITVVIPDAAVRVLLVEFDTLPARLADALPIVRFRLKKMLPFDADDAMVTYQIMSTSKTIVRVLAVAIPRDVLSEYESVVREAGFEPGAVIPSTLAALAAVDDENPVLLVNVNKFGVTAAIVRSGILMLHRSVDLQETPVGTPANLPPEIFESTIPSLPLVDVYETAEEWAAQEPLPEHGRDPYASEPVVPASVVHEPLSTLGLSAPIILGEEVAQAVSVAVAYFEDTLASLPSAILSAGPLGSDALTRILADHGLAQAEGLRVRELVEPAALLSEAVTASVPRGWLAGVTGALRG
jgi:type IV pilus assembly protein PilM